MEGLSTPNQEQPQAGLAILGDAWGEPLQGRFQVPAWTHLAKKGATRNPRSKQSEG